VGSPLSGLIAEIFLQHYKDANIKHHLDTKNIAFYARYVDDILIISDTTKIDSHTINDYINNIHSNIKLNPTYEEQDSIDYLDLKILQKHEKLEVHTYRKRTTTYTTINFMSNHPTEQKTTAYRFHINRMNSLPLNPNKKQKEWGKIQSIARKQSHSTYFKTSTDRYIAKPITHTQQK